MDLEQQKVVDRCGGMLKRALRGFKSIVFHLPPDDGPCEVHYEISGKIKVASEDKPCKVVSMLDDSA